MGYIIDKASQAIEKIVVTIPAADVAQLQSTPYELMPLDILNTKVLLSAHLSIVDPIGLIDNFRHFYLGYKADTNVEAVYDENNGDIGIVDAIYSFLINASHPPNRFGAKSQYRYYPFQITTEQNPNANCDLIVTMYFLV